jgi:hypothetical protein
MVFYSENEDIKKIKYKEKMFACVDYGSKRGE